MGQGRNPLPSGMRGQGPFRYFKRSAPWSKDHGLADFSLTVFVFLVPFDAVGVAIGIAVFVAIVVNVIAVAVAVVVIIVLVVAGAVVVAVVAVVRLFVAAVVATVAAVGEP